MTHFVDWASATVEWTVSGHELSAPLAPHASARQAKAVADAVEAALRRIRRDDIAVTFVEPEDETGGELLLTSPHLLNVEATLLRRTVDEAADAAANDSAALDAHEAGIIASWLAAVRAPH